MISVNKIIKKLAKGVKGYLRLRSIIKLHHILSGTFLLLGPPSRFLGVDSSGASLLGSFVVVLGFPEIRSGLQMNKQR